MSEYKIPVEMFSYAVATPFYDEEFLDIVKSNLMEFLQLKDENAMEWIFGPSCITFKVKYEDCSREFLCDEEEGYVRRMKMPMRFYPNIKEDCMCIEVPSVRSNGGFGIGEVFRSSAFKNAPARELTLAMGENAFNEMITYDLGKSPLFATGIAQSGKSTFLRTAVASLIYKHSPKDLQLLLISPYKETFLDFESLPHLLEKSIVSSFDGTMTCLKWAVAEMERRFVLFDKTSRSGKGFVVNIDQYNDLVETDEERLRKTVIVLDDLDVLLPNGRHALEGVIKALALKGRAAGFYLIVGAQAFESVAVCFPVRAAFKAHTREESEAMLFCDGAESMLGRGDYYFMEYSGNPVRMKAPFLPREDVRKLVGHIFVLNLEERQISFEELLRGAEKYKPSEVEPIYVKALKLAIEQKGISISMIQRKCDTGYNKAGRIISWMEEEGYVSEFNGTRMRDVWIDMEEMKKIFSKYFLDPLYLDALKLAVESGGISVSALQRNLGIDVSKAKKILEWMEGEGYVTDETPRKTLLSMDGYLHLCSLQCE